MSNHIIGVDECGWGSIAGPLVVCAAAIPKDFRMPGRLNDSKKLTPKTRKVLALELQDCPLLHHSIAVCEASTLDMEGPAEALFRTYVAALDGVLGRYPEARVYLDGSASSLGRVLEWLRVTQPKRGVYYEPKADALNPAVMSASVVGKVYHDELMAKLHARYPAYNFAKNQGYGSPPHLAALREHGPCPEHRRSYAPVKAALATAASRAEDAGDAADPGAG